MPGGQFTQSTHEECLTHEIKEELNCDVDLNSLSFIGIYEDVASGRSDKKVRIALYQGEIRGEPQASTEIKELHWIGFEDSSNINVSPIIRNKIIPDIIKRGILFIVPV